MARETLDDRGLAAQLDSLGAALHRTPQGDGDFFHDFQSRGDHFFHDGHDQGVTFSTDIGRSVDEAVDAAATDLDPLTPERWIDDGGASLHACAHAHDTGASNPRADEHALGGERDVDGLRFA